MRHQQDDNAPNRRKAPDWFDGCGLCGCGHLILTTRPDTPPDYAMEDDLLTCAQCGAVARVEVWGFDEASAGHWCADGDELEQFEGVQRG